MKAGRGTALFFLVVQLGGCSTVSMKMRFDSYCQSAGLHIVERLSGPQRVLLDESRITNRIYLRGGPFSLFSFVGTRNVEHVDTRTKTATRYLRFRKSLSFEIVRETDANILLKFESLTSTSDHELDLFGEQMTVSDRVSGRVIATYRYFWTTGALKDYCPKNRAAAPHPAAVAAYVIGLDDLSASYYERQYLPLPQ